MKKKIIVTSHQLNEMKRYMTEMEDANYVYIDSSSTLPSMTGLETVSANGGCPDYRNFEKIEPTTTDDVADTMCNMRTTRMSGSGFGVNKNFTDDEEDITESVEIGGGNYQGIGDDTIGNSQLLDTLSDGDDSDDDSMVNRTILAAVDRLINLTQSLPAKKKAMVLNKIIENYELESIPHTWKRQLIQKIWNSQQPNNAKN